MSSRNTKTPSPPSFSRSSNDDPQTLINKVFRQPRKSEEKTKHQRASYNRPPRSGVVRPLSQNHTSETSNSYRNHLARTTPASSSNNWKTLGASGPIFGNVPKFSTPLEDVDVRLKRLESSGILQKFRNSSCIDIEEDEEDIKTSKRDTVKSTRLSDVKENCPEVNPVSKAAQPVPNRVVLPKVGLPLEANKVAQRLFANSIEETPERRNAQINLKDSSTVSSKASTSKKSGMRTCKSEPDMSLSGDELDGRREVVKKNVQDSRVRACSPRINRSQSASRVKKSEDRDLQSIKVNNKTYYVLNVLGQGGSSKVYQVYEPVTQTTLALKIVYLNKADESTKKGFKNEINMLLKLRECKRVVRLYDYHLNDNSQQLILIMEKGDSDLSTVLKQLMETDGLDPHTIKHYWKEMLKAVDEIHKQGVVHSDLKPLNFISVGGKLKLIDFGISNQIETDHTSVMKDSPLGTINYMAPESLCSKPQVDPTGNKSGVKSIRFNCKADIWSLGCILYNLVYGKPPFGHLPTLIAKVQAICDPKYPISYPNYENPMVVDCIKRCLQRDPKLRPTAEELLRHPYINDDTSSSSDKSDLKGIYSQINNLTPSRIAELSKLLNRLAKA